MGVQSQETIRLIAVDSYSSSALWVKVFIEYFIPEVDRRLAEKGGYGLTGIRHSAAQLPKPGVYWIPCNMILRISA